MNARPITVSPDIDVAEARRIMARQRIGAAPVLENGQCIGIITERDLLKIVGRIGDFNDNTRVRDLMTPNPKTVDANTALATLRETMLRGGFRHAPVVDPNGKLAGMLSVRDVLAHIETKQSSATAQDLMEDAYIIDGDTPSLQDIARVLVEKRYTAALEVSNGQCTGIVTDRDVLKLAASGLTDPELEKYGLGVSTLQTQSPSTVGKAESAAAMKNKMLTGRFRNLPVVDDTGYPVGVVTILAVLAYT